MKKKLKQQNGETLIESLVAVLISTMAMAMLASSMTASANIHRQNKAADEKYKEDLEYAETYTGVLGTEDIKIEFKDSATNELIKEGTIKLYSNGAEGSFASYNSDSIAY